MQLALCATDGIFYLEESREKLGQVGDKGLIFFRPMAVGLWDVCASWKNGLKLRHEHLEEAVKFGLIRVPAWFQGSNLQGANTAQHRMAMLVSEFSAQPMPLPGVRC